jgi:hypothetical protein
MNPDELIESYYRDFKKLKGTYPDIKPGLAYFVSLLSLVDTRVAQPVWSSEQEDRLLKLRAMLAEAVKQKALDGVLGGSAANL